MISKWRILLAAIFGVRAFIFIFILHESLTPDTGEFASGRASWSSPLTALMGFLFGIGGVQVWGLLGAIALGTFLGKWGWKRGLFIFVSPPGWYTIQASSDAFGSAVSGYAVDRHGGFPSPFQAIPIAAFHLEAYLVVCFGWCMERCGISSRYFGIASGGIACIGEWHFQARYILPGLVIACIPNILPHLRLSRGTESSLSFLNHSIKRETP